MNLTTDMKNDRLVTVIIPTYGRADLLGACIQSVLNQTYSNIEIIVVDDNGEGTVNQKTTETVVLRTSNVKYIVHKRNYNGSVARNTGIMHSKGFYVCFLDDDDLFYPDKIAIQIKAIQGYDFCLCGFVKKSKKNEVYFGYSLRENILNEVLLSRKEFCSGSSILVRKDCVLDIGGFDEKLTRFQDINFLVKLSAKFKGIVIENILLQITIHQRSYKPENFMDIENNVINYIRSISSIINLQINSDRKKIMNENYYILIKKALLYRKINKFIYYSTLYGNKYKLFVRLCKDVYRKGKHTNRI